jgi:uncharacterized protein (DUF2267 family)
MDAHQFVTEVQAEADLPDREAAERAARATLQTLAERIVGDEAEDLAAQLPVELADALRSGAEADVFGFEEFVGRVAERADLDESHALRAAQSVLATAAHAVTGEEFRHVLSQLPNEYAPLLALAGGMPEDRQA